MGVPGTCTRININRVAESKKITSLTPPPPPPSSLLRLDLCSITGTFSFSLSLPLCFCMRFLVTGESSCADGRRFGRGVATILFIRRRKPPASPWRRECEAERSGQMARTKRATMEGGREGTSGNSFRILYPASATRQLIHPPLPLWTTSVNEDFISILGGVY